MQAMQTPTGRAELQRRYQEPPFGHGKCEKCIRHMWGYERESQKEIRESWRLS